MARKSSNSSLTPLRYNSPLLTNEGGIVINLFLNPVADQGANVQLLPDPA